MTDTNLITDDQLARLRAVAEDPLVAPSKRIEARTLLKEIRRLKEGAEGGQLRRELQRKIDTGRELTWRQRAIAQELGLIARRGTTDGALARNFSDFPAALAQVHR